jgi:hypothetical protein
MRTKTKRDFLSIWDKVADQWILEKGLKEKGSDSDKYDTLLWIAFLELCDPTFATAAELFRAGTISQEQVFLALKGASVLAGERASRSNTEDHP